MGEAPEVDALPRLLHQASLGSMVLAGAVGHVVVLTLGPYLAMFFAIWSGRTTEPAQPGVDLPLTPSLLCALLALTGWLWERRRRTEVRPSAPLWRSPMLLVHLGATVFALLPLFYLAWLVRLT